MPALTVHNAEVKTAAVEIRTLTISGKQVSLAVFRQLVEADLIDSESGLFRGQPWGVVNYHPDKVCATASDHRHVVWQLDSELRRAAVPAPRFNRRSNAFFEEGGYIQAAYCANGHLLPAWADAKRDPESGDYDVYFQFDGLQCVALQPSGPAPWASSDHQCTTNADEQRGWLKSDVAEELARRRQIEARWAEIVALPQLFIAV